MSAMVLSTTAAGTISQTARGLSNCLTKSASEEAGAALSLARALTASGEWSKATHRCPFLISRRTMLAPIRPRPIMPSCIVESLFISIQYYRRRHHLAIGRQTASQQRRPALFIGFSRVTPYSNRQVFEHIMVIG